VPLLSCTAMTTNTPPPWTNQPLVLYHGTVDTHVPAILAGIDLSQGRQNTDFGRGFYTTTIERQAIDRARQLSSFQLDAHPAVIRFDVDCDDLDGLSCLWFVRGARDADDFWQFVWHCRGAGDGHGRAAGDGWYDVVAGPVTAAWRRRRIMPNSDQVSFHTETAVRLLRAGQPRRIS
jgi:hypothetical protein